MSQFKAVGFLGSFILSGVLFFGLSLPSFAGELTLVVEDIYDWARSEEVHRAVFDVTGASCFDATIRSWWKGQSDPELVLRIFGEMTPINKDQDLVITYTKQIQKGEDVLAIVSHRSIVVEANQHPARIEDLYRYENAIALWQRNKFSYTAPPPEPTPKP